MKRGRSIEQPRFTIAYCLLPIAYCLLPIAFCLLPFACCLLPKYHIAFRIGCISSESMFLARKI